MCLDAEEEDKSETCALWHYICDYILRFRIQIQIFENSHHITTTDYTSGQLKMKYTETSASQQAKAVSQVVKQLVRQAIPTSRPHNHIEIIAVFWKPNER